MKHVDVSDYIEVERPPEEELVFVSGEIVDSELRLDFRTSAEHLIRSKYDKAETFQIAALFFKKAAESLPGGPVRDMFSKTLELEDL